MHFSARYQVVGVSSRRMGASLRVAALVLTILVISGLNVRVLGERSSDTLERPLVPLALDMRPQVGTTNYFVVILMENKNYVDVIGDWSTAPYINRLANDYGVATNYLQVSLNHSLPN